MRKLMGLKVALLVVSLLTMAAVPATAQLADPLSLAASGVLLPFFSDPASGFVSVLEVVSPVVPTQQGFLIPIGSRTNPLHAVFFNAACVRDGSIATVETAKQAIAFITTSSPLTLTFNGLAAIAQTVQGNDLVPLAFPLHTRTHWIDAKTGRLRELEPIILDTFVSLLEGSVPLVALGSQISVGLCAGTTPTYDSTGFPANLGAHAAFSSFYNNGFCWSPLRSAATFVTPQDTASLKASVVLICPTADIQQGDPSSTSIPGTPTHTGGVFNPSAGFPRIQNRDGSTGFPFRSVIDGLAKTALRGRIYDDDESGPVDFTTPCACLTVTPVLSLSSIYANPPKNLGSFTVPVWYTELETQTITSNVNTGTDSFTSQFSFTGYWNLEIAGTPATLFHRMSNASLDNLSFGNNNQFNNR
jgi:hypothetical protein